MTRSTLSLAGETDSSGDRTASASNGRGRSRIPQSEWPRIVQRQQRGDSKSAIARDYNCTPAAIAYILKRADQAGVAPADESAAPGAASASAASAPADGAAPGQSPRDGTRSSTRMTLRAPEAAPPPESAEAAQPAAEAASGGPAQAAAPAAPAASSGPAAPAAPAASGGSGGSPSGAASGGGNGGGDDRDSLQSRLSEATQQLDQAYRTWLGSHSEDAVSDLRASVHEMRKVLARFEVEIAASRQHEQSVEPFRYPGERGRWQSADDGPPRGTSKRTKK